MAEPAIKFDTAAAVDQLVEAGVPQKQAAAQVRLIANTINDNFATKADIERLELKLDTRIAEVRSEVANLETRLTGKIGELETRLTDKIDKLNDRAFNTLKWTAGMQVGTVVAIIAAIKLI